ncbi:hypothetical protein OOT00_15875 [Desulfobotulus sp. H1]|uniref:Uncharacterized protein n=1 Tax=Desulfobotulus pelophilus TaxID=2823377 RepID=A0ABT3NDB6_9BACT|nr:hypothetical protein [Desulfobotulus pelophilus]MCW7755455.1 hypothetical protein [Desulfobotulus pelophilus]
MYRVEKDINFLILYQTNGAFELIMAKTKKSIFVTILGVTFMVLSGLMFCFDLYQTIIAYLSGGMYVMRMQGTVAATSLQKYIFTYIDYISFSLSLLIFFVFISSVGLFRRKNWARIVFIGFMSLGVLFNLILLLAAVLAPSQEVLPHRQEEHDIWVLQVRWGLGLIAVLGSTFFSLIVYHLMSRRVKKEFNVIKEGPSHSIAG